MRIAIYHDYLTQYGGAERVLEALHELYPQADIFTLVYNADALPQYKTWPIKTSFAQHLPYAQKRYQWYLWVFPLAVWFWSFKHYDRVIVSTHAWGNGIRKQQARMITYCHTPVRYFWDLYEDYKKLKCVPWIARVLMPLAKPAVQWHDRRCAQKVDVFLANSEEVKGRIERCYGKSAQVVYPPVKVSFFSQALKQPLAVSENGEMRGDYYLIVSRLKKYKRIDLIIQACKELQKELIIVGSGPEEQHLRALAGLSTYFYQRVSDEKLLRLYAGARAYIYMAHEDFGMTLVEAQAAGIPVLAYGKGGACETVQHDVTGILFPEQTKESLQNAIIRCESRKWHRYQIQEHARSFSENAFKEAMRKHVGI